MLLSTYFLSCIIVGIYITILFFIALFKKDNSIMDIAYGPAFIFTSCILSLLALSLFPLEFHSLLILILMVLWGTRLSARIYSKNKGKPEDFRYAVWRDLWMSKGKFYFYARSYIQIFLLQGVIVSLVLLPFTLTLTTVYQASSLLVAGFLLWIFGFIFESVGDAQLDSFIKDKNPSKGTIMKSGLWKYTRHPNYFGEATMWVGIACIAFSVSGNIAVFLSPLVITYLLLFVSGIPMLEKKWAGVPEWEVYKSKTSAFIPLPPKS